MIYRIQIHGQQNVWLVTHASKSKGASRMQSPDLSRIEHTQIKQRMIGCIEHGDPLHITTRQSITEDVSSKGQSGCNVKIVIPSM